MFYEQELEWCLAGRDGNPADGIGEPYTSKRVVTGFLREHFVADERLVDGGARMKAQRENVRVGVHGNCDGLDSSLSPHDDRSASRALEAADDRVVFHLGRLDVRPGDDLKAVFFLELAAARCATQDRDE